jgi:hypothetical protein
MRKSRKILSAAAILCLATCFVIVFLFSAGSPGLTLTYLGQTNNSAGVVALFAITNSGKAAGVCYNSGQIEDSAHTITPVPCTPGLHMLPAGHGDIVRVVLPSAMPGRWRFTALYAHRGLRSRIYDWQWGPGGRGAQVNWLVPRFLKGVPLDVTTTSDWIGE